MPYCAMREWVEFKSCKLRECNCLNEVSACTKPDFCVCVFFVSNAQHIVVSKASASYDIPVLSQVCALTLKSIIVA
jgi:hypothetical protein